MANEIGLFGPTRAEVLAAQQQQDQSEALKLAQLDAPGMAAYQNVMLGKNLGRTVGGLLGAKDPQLEQVAAQENIIQWVQQNNVDMQTPEGIAQAVKYAQQVSPQLALKIADYGRNVAKEQQALELSKAHAKYYSEGGRGGKAGSVIPENQAESAMWESMKTNPKYKLPDGSFDGETAATDFKQWKNRIKAEGAGSAVTSKLEANDQYLDPKARGTIATNLGQVSANSDLNNQIEGIKPLIAKMNLDVLSKAGKDISEFIGGKFADDPNYKTLNDVHGIINKSVLQSLKGLKGSTSDKDLIFGIQSITNGDAFKSNAALIRTLEAIQRGIASENKRIEVENASLRSSNKKVPSSNTPSKPNAEVWIRAAMAKNPSMSREQVMKYLPDTYK